VLGKVAGSWKGKGFHPRRTCRKDEPTAIEHTLEKLRGGRLRDPKKYALHLRDMERRKGQTEALKCPVKGNVSTCVINKKLLKNRIETRRGDDQI